MARLRLILSLLALSVLAACGGRPTSAPAEQRLSRLPTVTPGSAELYSATATTPAQATKATATAGPTPQQRAGSGMPRLVFADSLW